MQLNPIVVEFGAYLPSIWDCSLKSAEWFIDNGQTESAKYVIRNMADEMERQESRNSEYRFDIKVLREENRELRNGKVKAQMIAKDLFKDLSNAKTEIDEAYKSLRLANDNTEHYKKIYEEERDYALRVNDALDSANCRIASLEIENRRDNITLKFVEKVSIIRSRENKGLRQSYGKVKRAMLSLKRKVKEMTEVIYNQAQIIEDLRERIEDLERENSELNERSAHYSYYSHIRGQF